MLKSVTIFSEMKFYFIFIYFYPNIIHVFLRRSIQRVYYDFQEKYRNFSRISLSVYVSLH